MLFLSGINLKSMKVYFFNFHKDNVRNRLLRITKSIFNDHKIKKTSFAFKRINASNKAIGNVAME
jgi:hypothetical protein